MKSFLIRNEGEFNFKCLGLGNTGIIAWNAFSKGLIEAFCDCFENKVQVINHDLETIKIEVYRKSKSLPTISIDPCIPGDINLGISHVYSFGGEGNTRISNRPGFPSLDKQIGKIPAGDYILIEDDIFSGNTIKYVTKILLRNRINIKFVVVSIQVGNSAKVNIPIESVYSYRDEDVIDLNNPRDILAGGYEGGLVVQNVKLCPSVDQDEVRSRIPCLLPFSDMTSRLSIPKEKTLSLSRQIWNLNKEFWKLFPHVKISDVDKYFIPTPLRLGFKPSDNMVSFCHSIYDALSS